MKKHVFEAFFMVMKWNKHLWSDFMITKWKIRFWSDFILTKWKNTFLKQFHAIYKRNNFVLKRFSLRNTFLNHFFTFTKSIKRVFEEFSCLQNEKKLIFEEFSFLQNEKKKKTFLKRFSCLQNENHVFEANLFSQKWKLRFWNIFIFTKWKHLVFEKCFKTVIFIL